MSLALPSRPSFAPKASQALEREALDEADDVDDSDLLDIPHPRKRLVDVDVDPDLEGEKDDDEDEGNDVGVNIGMGTLGVGLAGAVEKEKGKRRDADDEIEKRGKKRRAETFLLRGQMDEEQARRFDTFSTVAINKNVIKRLNRDLFDQHCPPQLSQVVAGMAKVFVADVIEMAKDLQPHSAHPTGPLQPYHLKLARMCLEEQGMVCSLTQGPVSGLRKGKALFRRR
ncbi:transcription initiation factor TFIID subunit 11 [Cryptococcus deuterogattii R265]|uniref:transcription initiation factor TFIID subunit 11 n=1 Tax=Cryptococcus deuterogattii (strain R265) TaxID=294750 RepID=UPI001935EF14|nr:transcription initiation factor TFIID subunit 11 [Cryptococcus deuterogattii R265]